MLTAEQHELLREAIRSAESKSAGEIYVVVDDVADEFRLVPVLWASVLALLVPWIGYFATSWDVTTLLLSQGVTFVAFSVLLSLPVLRHRVVPAAMADDAAFRNARAVFLAHGVHLTAARTGVLIYVSRAPRRIVVLADAGIHEKVEPETWQRLVHQIRVRAREGLLVEGLCGAIASIGELLARHFPRAPEDRNELPDRVVEI